MQPLQMIDPSLRSNTIPSPSHPGSQRFQDGVQVPMPPYSPLRTSPGTTYMNARTPAYYSSTQQLHESPEFQSSPGPNQDPSDLKRPRACEACRQLKVKCELDDVSPTGSCKRCAKAHRQCIVTVPSRKRQKKTDSRVAELEKKIDALTATLVARGGNDTDAAPDTATAPQHYQPSTVPYADRWPPTRTQAHQSASPVTTSQVIGVKRRPTDPFEPFGGELPRPPVQHRPPPPLPPHSQSRSAHLHSHTVAPDLARRPPSTDLLPAPTRDIIDAGLIDAQTAYRCFDRYATEMCHQLPVVVFPPGTRAEDVRKTRPILFEAIVAVACGTIRSDLQPRLISDATRVLADRIVFSGEKSLELVQTIQVMSIWYQPPERYEELNFNQLIHIAAVMATDIGMGKRSRKGAPVKWKGFADKNKMMPDPMSAETRRCWLGCYYMCSNSSMSLRRPLFVRWTPYADECLQILHAAQDALPSDRWLCHIVQAQHIAEMIGAEFAMDDPAQELKITDPMVQSHLRGLEQKLKEWHDSAQDLLQNPIMKHTKAIINLYMHEIAMHNEHNIDDFRPPYHSTPIEGPPDPDSVTPVHINSLTACLQSAHAAFDAFLEMDIKLLRALPTHFFVRNSYAAVALIKLYTAMSSKDSKTSAAFNADVLRVEEYLDALIGVLEKVAEGSMSKVAWKFSLIFKMLRKWHLKRTDSPNGRGSREHSQPRMPVTNGDSKSRSYSMNPTIPAPNPQHLPQTPQIHRPQPPTWHQRPHIDQSPRTGLQTLSDAAMALPSTLNLRNPAPASGASSTSNQWLTPSNPHLVPAMLSNPDPNAPQTSSIHIHDPMMTASPYGLPSHDLSLMDFTSDELMAYGFGDEFMAMNFGFENAGGWVM